jgi:predicted enzyme related to lactoylglutathione lyase
MLGTMQVKVLAEFYTQLFGKPADMVDEGGHGWATDGAFFMIGEHSEMSGPAKDPGRILLNFETTDVKGEFKRIKAIPGAKVIKEPYAMGDAWIATLEDPDRNLFQLMTPWEA